MHRLRTEVFFLRYGIEFLQDITSFAGRFRSAGYSEVVATIMNLDIESTFYQAQVLIELAAQISQPLVVGGLQIKFLNDCI